MGKDDNVQIREMKYSVLMSVYAKDNPEYLAEAINSMLMQTIPPEQFVIVIDGSVSDKLKQIICKYQNDYADLFTILPLKHNGGLGNALNVGLRYCRNELVARMDADDISLPERCEKELLEFGKYPDLAICGCNIDEFEGEPGNVLRSRIVPVNDKEIKKMMRRRQAFNHPTVIYKKSAVLKEGGYIAIKRKEDFDLFSKMMVAGDLAGNLKESLYLYRVNSDNYKRRKSWDNFRSAMYVYWRHLKRKGCSVCDFLFVFASELFFFLAPYPIAKAFSDKFLRVRYSNK